GWEFLPHASGRLATLGRLPPPTASDPTFLWIGTLNERKRPDLFVATMAALGGLRPGVRGLMAGTGPLGPAITQQIDREGAPVELMGQVADISALLRQAWAVVLLSETEGVPFALQEAMWAGRSIVASSLPGNRWLVGAQGQGGSLVDTVDGALSALLPLCERHHASRAGELAAARIRLLLGPDDPWPAVERAYGHAAQQR
ncbi:MAG: glycosyltransferase, partial [Acidimicrobiales bacterium]